MSNTSPTTWIHGLFREVGVMALAVMLSSLTFAAAAEAQPAPNQGTPVWSMLAKADAVPGHAA